LLWLDLLGKSAIRQDSKIHKANNTITTQIGSRFGFIATEPQREHLQIEGSPIASEKNNWFLS